MKRIRFVLLFLLAVILLIQLIRPEKNLGSIDTPEDFLQVSRVPDTLGRIFLESCYDCHSNNTKYPWYASVAPVSWLLNRHIVEGKAHLNFSSWAIMEKTQKISLLDDICEECSDGSMPLPGYVRIHHSTALGPDEIEAICGWAEQEAMNLMGGE